MSTVENVPDERLLIEAAQQDPALFAELYDQNFDRVYAFVASRIHNRDQAEEITAEVFHQALANLGRFEWRGVPFAAWLVRIAVNAIHDRWKSSAREDELPQSIEAPGTDYAIERRAMLAKLIDTLPDDQRLVVVRRFVEQRSIREIAAELGRSEGAVKQLQFRALQNLKERVKGHHE